MNELDAFYDDVARVAYELFEKRGKFHGFDMDDWLEAEMIVKKIYENKPEPAAQHPVSGSPAGAKARKKSKTKTAK